MERWLLLIYFIVLSLGFLCCVFATIVPFWFSKFPTAKTHFLNLGLWEVCLDGFISPDEQQIIYSGCFYIFDSKIRPIWPDFFPAWLHASQALQILAMLSFTLIICAALSIILNLVDKRQPNVVLTSVCLLIFICKF